ncbi:glycosyltransferase [Psychroflexus lacisalsi]|uniref:Glycosyltransferase n=1 Tax=Psychroflexus lacisalsi TaxID=503928 RepID=A0ABP3VF35_9FLAO|nr:glycosyltransferase [Psychroflexus lacisalsi]MBZ9619166.1 glycosyltransferase [Psychroflexus lacisalsi]
MSWLVVFYFILGLYVLYILSLTLGLSKLKSTDLKLQNQLKTKFSVVIPMRNEAENLPALFQSISELSYPKNLFEIILVDDDSQDASWKFAREFQARYRDIKICLLSISEEKYTPKKNAICTAIRKSSFSYILTTDADVILPENWLKSLDAKLQSTGADIIAGGVVVTKKSSFLSHYQHFDMLSLQLFGLGSFAQKYPVVCNGANLCFRKSAYLEADVNRGKENIASGDDVFTLQKFKQLGFKIDFLTDSQSVVWTQALESFEGLWQQRRRWASKTASVESWYLKSVGILVTLMQLTLILSLILWFWESAFFGFLINAFLLKFFVDGWSLTRMVKIQNLGFCWTDFLKVSLVYPFFTLFFSLTSFFGKFEWKGRRFQK